MGMIEDGLAMLNDMLAVEASVQVTFNRTTGTPIGSVPVNAVPSKPPFVAQTGTNPVDPTKAERNFSVMASDLVISDILIQPTTNDSITETIGDTTYVYKVANPASGVGCWEWENGYQNGSPLARILIHTKFYGTA